MSYLKQPGLKGDFGQGICSQIWLQPFDNLDLFMCSKKDNSLSKDLSSQANHHTSLAATLEATAVSFSGKVNCGEENRKQPFPKLTQESPLQETR